MGVPGLASWLSTIPLNVSAVCWISVPTSVTGATNPESGIAMNSTGMEYLAQSSTFWEVTALHLNGDVGQQENTARGFNFSPWADPLTVTSMSFITSNDSIVKVPVTTALRE